jgi:hypothetical protein
VEGRRQSKKQERKWTQKLSLSQVTKWWSWYWDLERILIYWMCLDVKSFALVLNVEFRTLGCQWMRWLGGIYSPQPLSSRWKSLLAMGTPNSPVAHWTVTVHYPVRATSARRLGFGAVDRWRSLSFCCTGQSGDLWLLRSDLCATLFIWAVDRWRAGSRCSAGSPDSPVHTR